MLTALLANGWSVVALFFLTLISRSLRLMGMKVVFVAFRVPHDRQVEWVLREARRNDKLTLARGFWNRTSRKGRTAGERVTPIQAGRHSATVAVAEQADRPRGTRSPAA